MKYDEFAFFNQQLSAMLREGIPLEGALKQLCAGLRRGALRSELERLESDLKNGVPFQQALEARKLPSLYVKMLQVGIQSNDLPGVLQMLADYYQRVDATWTRLKGLMVYPLIVLIASFALSCFLTFTINNIFYSGFFEAMGFTPLPGILVGLWAPPIVIGALLVIVLIVVCVPPWRRSLRWRLPAFKEAKLAQVATAMSLMLKTGGNLGDALGLVEQMEKGTVASAELASWHARLKHGHGQFSEMAEPGRAFPPLFVWMVTNAGEDLSAGFRRAAEIYNARAMNRIDTFLYAALPFSIFALGIMICLQIIPIVRNFTQMISWLSG